METCTECGGSLSEEDDRCPSCGEARAREPDDAGAAPADAQARDPEAHSADASSADASDARASSADASDASANGADVSDIAANGADASSTDASAADPNDADLEDEGPFADEEPPSVPAGTWASTSDLDSPAVPEGPETRRIRSLTREPDSAARAGYAEARQEPSERGQATRRDASRPVRRPRPEAVTPIVKNGRARGLAVATAAEAEEDTPRPEGRVVAFPGSPPPRAADATPAQPATASSSGMRAPAAVPAGPPRWLASELLRERPPAEPLLWTSRVLAAIGGAGVIAVVAVFGAAVGMHLGLAALGGATALAAVAPVRFALRSGALAVLGSAGLVLATLARSETGSITGLAAMGATLLAAAQLLRAVHRTSRFARAAMMVGIAVSASWLALDGGIDGMVVLDEAVEAWVGPAVRALLLVVLALSLLAFIDASGDSGCRVWPWLVLGWLAVEGGSAALAGPLAGATAAAATPLFAAVAAVGWMQVWATTPGLGREVRGRGDG